MQIEYDEVDPMHRVGVVVHEYFHVVQLERCLYPAHDVKMVWMWEGGAAALEELYTVRAALGRLSAVRFSYYR